MVNFKPRSAGFAPTFYPSFMFSWHVIPRTVLRYKTRLEGGHKSCGSGFEVDHLWQIFTLWCVPKVVWILHSDMVPQKYFTLWCGPYQKPLKSDMDQTFFYSLIWSELQNFFDSEQNGSGKNGYVFLWKFSDSKSSMFATLPHHASEYS